MCLDLAREMRHVAPLALQRGWRRLSALGYGPYLVLHEMLFPVDRAM